MNIDGHVVAALLFVNIHVHPNPWAIFFPPRPHFFHNPRMCFFYYYRRRRRRGACFNWRSGYGCGRLLTRGDSE
jgi:hypothetical protein